MSAVTAPAISAPASARTVPQRGIVPPDAPVNQGNPWAKIGGLLGGRGADLVYETVVDHVNDVWMRSRPKGKPVPPQQGSWKFAAVGDIGWGSVASAAVASKIVKGKPDLVLTLGDNVYPKGRESEWQANWDPDRFWGQVHKVAPIMPSLGNHDVKADPSLAPYFKRFPHLNGARYYSFNKGDVHFVALDSNQSMAPGSPQYQWLDRDLADHAGVGWRVLYFHHPLLAGSERQKSSQLLEHLGPLLARRGVDLVLNGHEHWYERTQALNDHGTRQVTVGTGGAPPYPFTFRQNEWSATRDVGFGHLEVEVRNDALVGRQVLRDGRRGDTFLVPRKPLVTAATTAATAAPGAAA